MRARRARRASALVRGVMILGAVILTAACSEHVDPMGPGDNDDGPVVEIEIRNFEFSQPELRIAPGTTVRWRNTTSNYHTVTPDGHTAWTQWQTAGMGETFAVRFDQAGAYPYYCMPHRSLGMTGTIVVE